MAANNGSPEPTQPLSVDKVITAGVQLYRSHLQDYFLMNIPVQIALQILFNMISVFLPSLPWMYGVTLIAISFSVSALTLPLYQTIIAVIYYDLRSRREGLGLKLRDGEI
ncbi:MAG: hypothetical protein EA343_10290 [Nodularia sp. (in: Bacteria)]|nr:MAG: hypothetical protein EA343_10290 [Nodularia sp. (in: cyanobacteria)]